MKIDELLKDLNSRFKNAVLNTDKKSDKRAYVDIDPKGLTEIVKYLFKDLGLRFNIASGLDTFDGMEILYHFSDDQRNYVVSLRALLGDKENAHIDTITHITDSAWWIEREIYELLGVTFDDNKDLRPLLLADDWPKGVYPLRKDFVPSRRDSRGSSHRPEEK